MKSLMDVYDRLCEDFGPQNWWPAKDAFEVILGAILTQQTTWTNVERAIGNLRQAGLLSPKALAQADVDDIAPLIAPCGFHTTKPARLKRMASYIVEHYEDLDSFLGKPAELLREELLNLDGIGPETADSIMCYASDKMFFVVDAYTIRIGRRLGLFELEEYDEIQFYFQRIVPKDLRIYREFHALMVELGKTHCRRKPRCDSCPLLDMCDYARRSYGD